MDKNIIKTLCMLNIFDHLALIWAYGFMRYSKTCVKRPLSKDRKLIFKTNYRVMQVKSIADCSKGSILQYFRPALSYHLSLRSLICLFLSGRLTQVLLYFFFLQVQDFSSSWQSCVSSVRSMILYPSTRTAAVARQRKICPCHRRGSCLCSVSSVYSSPT